MSRSGAARRAGEAARTLLRGYQSACQHRDAKLAAAFQGALHEASEAYVQRIRLLLEETKKARSEGEPR